MVVGGYVLHLYCEDAETSADCPAIWGQAYKANNVTEAKIVARLDGWKFGTDIAGCETCYCRNCK